jgi:hypothetical protein
MTSYRILDSHKGYNFEWDLKILPFNQPYPPRINCPDCGGRGRTNMCMGSIDDPEDCYKCNKTGKIDDPSWVWKPSPPKELVDHMRKAWIEYWNKDQNDKFTLT